MAEVTTAQQIAELREAIASGATEVSYNGKKVVYRSLSEMRSILEGLESEETGRPRPRRRRFASFSSGF